MLNLIELIAQHGKEPVLGRDLDFHHVMVAHPEAVAFHHEHQRKHLLPESFLCQAPGQELFFEALGMKKAWSAMGSSIV